jgi:hypothetical protein
MITDATFYSTSNFDQSSSLYFSKPDHRFIHFDGFLLLDERSRIAGISRNTLKEYFLKPLMFNRFKSADVNKSFDLSTI